LSLLLQFFNSPIDIFKSLDGYTAVFENILMLQRSLGLALLFEGLNQALPALSGHIHSNIQMPQHIFSPAATAG
jgi:hypothetical protein